MVIMVATSLKEILKSDYFKRFVGNAKVIYIKPNLCTMRGPPATTPVHFVKEVVLFLLDNNITPKIVESDQATTSAETRAKFLGYLDLGVDFINLSQTPSSIVRLSDGRKMKLPEILLDEKAKILNMPMIKATDVGYFTCCIKNLFGLLQTPYKGKFHDVLPEVLVNLYSIFNKKTFSIVYGGVAMEGKGSPVKGKTVIFEDFFLGGDDMMEMDVFIAKTVCGFNISKIPYLTEKEANVINPEIIDEIKRRQPKFGRLQPCEESLLKRGYYFIWEHMDSEILAPLRKMLAYRYRRRAMRSGAT